jgi:hypothetical protein
MGVLRSTNPLQKSFIRMLTSLEPPEAGDKQDPITTKQQVHVQDAWSFTRIMK